MKAACSMLTILLLLLFLHGCSGTQANPTSNPIEGSSNNSNQEEEPEYTGDLDSEEVEDLLKQSQEALASNDLDRAESTLKQIISSGAKSAEAYYNLGVIYERKNENNLAEEAYQDSIKINSKYLNSIRAYSLLLARNSKIDQALSFIESRVQESPDSLEYKNVYNRLRLNKAKSSQQIKPIIADIKKLLKIDEKNVEAMVVLASCFYKQGKYELSFAILENAKALDGENFEILFKMANSKIKLDEFRVAQQILEDATQIDQSNGATAEIHNTLGLLYHRTGNYTLAEEQFRSALKRWPDMLAAQINLGNTLKSQQKYLDSMEIFNRAYEKNPRSPELLYNMAILFLDGKIENLSGIEKLQKSIDYFNQFNQVTTKPDENVANYVKEAQKRLEVEIKKAEQARNQAKEVDEGESGGGESDQEGDAEGGDSEGDTEGEGAETGSVPSAVPEEGDSPPPGEGESPTDDAPSSDEGEEQPSE